MAAEYKSNPNDFHLYDVDEYIDLAIDFAERLSPHIAIERFVSQSPAELLIAPNWGIKNYEFTAVEANERTRYLARKIVHRSLSWFNGGFVISVSPFARILYPVVRNYNTDIC